MGSGTSSLEEKPKFVTKKAFERAVDSSVQRLATEERLGYGQGYRVAMASTNINTDLISEGAHQTTKREALQIPIIVDEGSVKFTHIGDGFYCMGFNIKVVKSGLLVIFFGCGEDDDELGRPLVANKKVGPYILSEKNSEFIQPRETSIGLDLLGSETCSNHKFIVIHIYTPEASGFVKAFIIHARVNRQTDGLSNSYSLNITRRDVICHNNERITLESVFGLPTTLPQQSQNTNQGSANNQVPAPGVANSDLNCEQDCTCSLCFTNSSNTMMLPCRHVCMCSECSEEFKRSGLGSCPICRKPVIKMETIIV